MHKGKGAVPSEKVVGARNYEDQFNDYSKRVRMRW